LSIVERIRYLGSFARSLKAAAIRADSTVMNFWWGYSRKNWKIKGIQHLRNFIEKHTTNGVCLFLINNPEKDSIDREVARLIHQAALEKSATIVLTAFAETVSKRVPKGHSLVTRVHKELHFPPSAASILVEEHRVRDAHWYSAIVLIGTEATKRYGPLYFF
jgi:hypothetical protein